MTKSYDWIIVGGGAAGIAIAEMLSRMNFSTLIIERNTKLASETSRDFHEWLHTGVLYALSRDKFETARYLLGAMDDLFTFYSHFKGMNIQPLERGLTVNGKGWFNPNNIHLRYRARPGNFKWSSSVARSKWFIEQINKHDFLRRRAGCFLDDNHFGIADLFEHFPKKLDGFTDIIGSDITINSRLLLSDLLNNYENQGGEIISDCDVLSLNSTNTVAEIETNRGNFTAKHVAICAAGGITKFIDANVQTSFAPMFVFDGVDESVQSFVELDSNESKCINLINKNNGIALAGGISLPTMNQVPEYVDYCIKLHKKRNPKIQLLHSYIGKKQELVGNGQRRNYLFHILQASHNMTGVVLGKFTLAFSLAPEFIRRIYGVNPPISSQREPTQQHKTHRLLSNTVWHDIASQKEK